MELKKRKEVVEALLDTFFEAGKEAKKKAQDGLKITIKSDKSPVTNGDIIVDEILRKNITKLTPNIPIISEETVNIKKENKNETFWLIDPIDGTKEYINNKDEYTLNAALIVDKIPSIGIIYAPVKERLFFSYGKKYAFEIRNNEKKILNCEKKTSKGKIFALTHTKNPSTSTLNILKNYQVNSFTKMSSSYKFCIIAAGEADIYTCEPRAYEWDIAAGHAILESAGGSITTQSGNLIHYGKTGFLNPSLLAKRSSSLDQ